MAVKERMMCRYSEMGTVVIGKVESGGVRKGETLLVMPNRSEVKVDQLWSDDIEVTGVTSGENIKVKLKGIDEADVSPGFVLCCPTNPIKTGKIFDAQVGMLKRLKLYIIELWHKIKEPLLKT